MLKNPLIRIAVIILATFAIASFAILYYHNIKEEKLKTAQKFDNIESEIFGNGEIKNEAEQKRIEDINQVYSLTVHNQIEIDNLRGEINDLKKQITVYGDQKNFSKLIFTYYDLRSNIFSSNDYKIQLENFKLLAAFDVNLKSRVAAFEEILLQTKTPKNIENDFQKLIPQLIKLQKREISNNVFDRFKSYVLQAIVIRSTDETKAQNIDKIILHLEKLLEKKSYQQAFDVLEKLPPEYKEVTKEFSKDINNLAKLQELDNNILSYLKGLV